MKVIIPVAGAGTKLRPFTYTQPKALIPLAGSTILGYIIDALLDYGAQEFVFVIGHLGEKIQTYVQEKYPMLKAHFVVQTSRDGTAHAVLLAKEFVKPNEEVLILYGDTIVECDLPKLMDSKHSGFIVKKVEDPLSFGIVECDGDGKVKHVVEKPKVPKSNVALVGMYRIVETEILFSIIEKALAQNTDGKYTLTHAIDAMIQQGITFNMLHASNWYDCGKKETLLATNASLLKKFEFASDEVPFFENTIIIHPVSIAEGCDIQNSIVGPNVTIGENAKITNSIVSDSIIGSYSELLKIVLHNSLIGNDAVLKGYSQSLNIGDNTEIDLQ
jgi:glucose-1-phosphate thymidylyltransferase